MSKKNAFSNLVITIKLFAVALARFSSPLFH